MVLEQAHSLHKEDPSVLIDGKIKNYMPLFEKDLKIYTWTTLTLDYLVDLASMRSRVLSKIRKENYCVLNKQV